MKKFSTVKGTNYSYSNLHFPSRPSEVPVNSQFSNVVARIGGPGKKEIVLVCENLEDIHILWDLFDNGNLLYLAWGIVVRQP